MKNTKIVQMACLTAALAWGVNSAKATDDKYHVDRSDEIKWGVERFPEVTAVPEPSTIIAGSLLVLPFALSAMRSRFRRK
jgi:hypothetical protein